MPRQLPFPTPADWNPPRLQLFFVHPDICKVDVWGRSVSPPESRRNALSLYVSSDGHHFSKVCLPTDLTDSAYTMISTQDGRGAFMIADHSDDNAAVSNLCVPLTHNR